jgi:TonB family protein
MASSEKLAPVLPDTLPENFSEWDNDASSSAAPGGADEWESVVSQSAPSAQKAQGEPANLDQILSSMADRSRVWRSDSHAPVVAPVIDRPLNEYVNLEKETSPAPSARKTAEPAAKSAGTEAPKPFGRPRENKMVFSPALENPPEDWPAVSEPVFAESEKASAELSVETPSPAAPQPEAKQTPGETSAVTNSRSVGLAGETRKSSEVTNSMAREADKVLFEVFSTKSPEDDEEPKPGILQNKKLMVVAGAAAAVLVPLILVLSLSHRGARAAVKPSVQLISETTDTQPETSAPDQPAAEPLTQVKPSAATKSQQAPESDAAQTGTEADSTPAASESQVQMMKDQLTAPKMISGDARKQIAENAPPPESMGGASMDALAGGAPAPSAFVAGAKPVVKALKPVSISSGVATGMLIRETPPVYPTIAKAARVAGTVELAATISKTGTIKDLRVVGGPIMLRQSALDAVRTWRYKPYELNHEPAEVETTINVVFSLTN